IKKRRHCQKSLSNGLDIDHDHHIWYEKSVVNSIFTLSEVDSIISERALSSRQVWAPVAELTLAATGEPAALRRFRPFGDKRLTCRVLTNAPCAAGFAGLQMATGPLKWVKNFKLV